MIICMLYADPYLNTDAGTMSPFEHGEVFVLDDGGEVRMPYCKFAILSCIDVLLKLMHCVSNR